MNAARLFRILQALSWSQTDMLRRLNRRTGARYKLGDAWKWLNEKRSVPTTVALFMRDAVEIEVLRRKLARRSLKYP
jgi:hypothetical protein